MMDSPCPFASQGAGSTDIFSSEEVMRGHTHLQQEPAASRLVQESSKEHVGWVWRQNRWLSGLCLETWDKEVQEESII